MSAKTAHRPKGGGGRVYRQPPPRGVPFYDVARGRKMILPREGGKIVPYVESSSAGGFSARGALRKAGIRGRDLGAASVRAGDRAAAAAPKTTARAVRRNVPGLLPSTSPGSYGGLLVWAFASIVALALLENALSGRGPVAVQRIFSLLGGTITRLVSPADPLVPKGPAPAAGAAVAPLLPGSPGGAPAGTRKTVAGGKPLTSSPTKLNGVTLTGTSLVGVRGGFLDALTRAAAHAGVTAIDVISARRSPEANASAGGVSRSNHLTGDALDGRAFLHGKWVPLGTIPGLSVFGLRSGNTPGFFNGHPDPNHVDDGANQ